MRKETMFVKQMLSNFRRAKLLQEWLSIFLQVALIVGIFTSWGALGQAQNSGYVLTFPTSPETRAATGFTRFTLKELSDGSTRLVADSTQSIEVLTLDLNIREEAQGVLVFHFETGNFSGDVGRLYPDGTIEFNQSQIQQLVQSSPEVGALTWNGDLVVGDILNAIDVNLGDIEPYGVRSQGKNSNLIGDDILRDTDQLVGDLGAYAAQATKENCFGLGMAAGIALAGCSLGVWPMCFLFIGIVSFAAELGCFENSNK